MSRTKRNAGVLVGKLNVATHWMLMFLNNGFKHESWPNIHQYRFPVDPVSAILFHFFIFIPSLLQSM